MDSATLLAIADNLAEGFVVFDAKERLVVANRAGRELFAWTAVGVEPGVTMHELFRATWETGIVDADADEFEGWYENITADQRVSAKPYEQRLSDGRVLRVRNQTLADGTRLTCVSDVTGKAMVTASDVAQSTMPQGAIATQQSIPDFTTPQRTKAGRQADAEMLARVIAHSPIILWATDLDGTIVLSEGKGLRAQSYSSDELVGRRIQDVYGDHPDFLANVERARAGESFTASNWTAGGCFERYFEPLRDDAGTIVGVSGVSFDVTERMLAEQELDRYRGNLERLVADRTQALENSEARLRRILESSPAGVAVITSDTFERLFVNQRYLQMFGAKDTGEMNQVELPGTYVDPSLWEPLHRSLLADGYLKGVEVERVRLDGTTVWLQIDGELVDFEGRPAAIVWHYDVTERRRQTDELRRINDALASEIAERTRAEADARRAKDEAESHLAELHEVQERLLRNERLAVLGQLTGTVSHELRNPLGTVQASLEIIEQLADAPDPDRSKRAIARAKRAIRRSVAIIEQLLDYARTPALQTTPVALDDWLRETIEELETPPPYVVSLDLQSAVTVQLDCDRFRQALVNALHNAWHASDEAAESTNRAAIRVRTQVCAQQVRISISDNGGGISDEMLATVFEPLVSTKSFGVGLGLPLVRQVMQQHGGGAEFSRTDPGHTTLCLWLPLNVDGPPDGGAVAAGAQ